MSVDDRLGGNPPLRRADDIIQRVVEEADRSAQNRVNGLDRILSERIQALADRYASVLEVKEHQHEEMDRRYQQRFEAQQNAIEIASEERGMRYQQRFEAQEKAVEVALAGVDKEFHEHLQQVRSETDAALGAADRAISKSELAVERRFEALDRALNKADEATEQRFRAINGYREQLAEQARTLMPRAEAEQRIAANAEKVEALSRQFTDAMAQVNSRLDLAAGRETGISAGWGFLVGGVGALGAIIAIMSAVYGG